MQAFGRYQLEHRVGVGGMGEVYAAKVTGAEGFERPVAIKVILPDLCDDTTFRDMFVDEAKITMHLQHQNIVQVLDLGEVGGRYYIAMEYVEGPNLSRILKVLAKRGALLPVPLGVYVTMEVLKALHYAHNARDRSGAALHIVHRDVTPQNVLLSLSGEVKLSDFGIARAATRVQRTATGVVRGKLYYLSPEQFEASPPIGPWLDVYAAGMVLQTMLLGKNPLDGLAEGEVIDKLRSYQSPLAADAKIPVGLRSVLETALEPNYRKRYQTAGAFLEALEEFVLKNQVKTGARHLAEFLHQIAVQEAAERGLPPPPSLSPTEGATTQTPSSGTGTNSASLALVVGTIDESSFDPPVKGSRPPPLAPDLSVPPARPRPRAAGAAFAIGGAALVATAWIAGRQVRDHAPPTLPPVASHAAAMPRASDVGWLFFDPFPWADCTIDGAPAGASPLVGRPLSPGRHQLEFRGVDGRVGTRSFEIRAGHPTVVTP